MFAPMSMMTLAKKMTPHFDADEDFIDYLNTFCNSARVSLETAKATGDKKKEQYYAGIIFALRSISQVYADLIKGEYI